MLRFFAWFAGIVVALVVGVFLLQMAASESGEVVVLHTKEGGGETTTRLWVVDRDGAPWLRSGAGESGWYRRLAADPAIALERGGERFDCVAEPQPQLRDEINAQMAAKYGWRDRVIGLLVGSRDDAIPVRLHCTPAAAA
jgi:hypothetical protein